MKIEFTQEDIDTGIKNSCTCCPVAKALFRHTGILFEVTRDSHGSFGPKYYHLDHFKDLPLEVTVFIKHFDEELPVSPISFEFEIPEDVEQ